MTDCIIVERMPTPEEYQRLCVSVGWKDVMNFAAAETALVNSLYGVVAMQDARAVGMGRIVGDGAIFFYIQDIAVSVLYQRRGIGTRIVDALMTYLRRNAPERAFVGVFAAEGTMPFYERYGFKNYAPSMTGMFRVAPVQ